MPSSKRYAHFASLLNARKTCRERGNGEWEEKHTDRLKKMADEMPSGSGFDNGTELDLDASTEDRLVFHTSFHHMDENGCYDGWTEHSVIVTPSLAFGYNLRVTGRDRRDIKDYIHECFSAALDEVEEW